MADEKPEAPPQDAAAATSPPAAAASPVQAAPAEAPVVEAAPVEAPVEAAAPERTPSLLESATAEEKPVEEKPADAKPADEVAAEKPADPAADAPADEKPAEAAKEGEPKPADAKPEEKPAEAAAEEKPPEAPPAVEYKYELPEAIKMDDGQRGEFHGALDKFRANPADPTPLIEQGVRMMENHDRFLRDEQYRVFNETKANWRKEVMGDEHLGGAGHQTAMQQIAKVRDFAVSRHPRGSKEWEADLAAFNYALDATGAGDNPAILRTFYNMARLLTEPAAPTITDTKPVAQRKRGGDVLYDKTDFNRDGG